MDNVLTWVIAVAVFIFAVVPVTGSFEDIGAGRILTEAHAVNFGEIYEQFHSDPVPVVGCTAKYKNDSFQMRNPYFGIIETGKSGDCRTIDVLTCYGGNRHVNSFQSRSCLREGEEYFLVDFHTGYLLINKRPSARTDSQFLYCLYHDSDRTIALALIDFKKNSPDNVKAVEFARSIGVDKPLVLEVAQKAAEVAGFDMGGAYSSLLKDGAEVLMEKSPSRK